MFRVNELSNRNDNVQEKSKFVPYQNIKKKEDLKINVPDFSNPPKKNQKLWWMEKKKEDLKINVPDFSKHN